MRPFVAVYESRWLARRIVRFSTTRHTVPLLLPRISRGGEAAAGDAGKKRGVRGPPCSEKHETPRGKPVVSFPHERPLKGPPCSEKHEPPWSKPVVSFSRRASFDPRDLRDHGLLYVQADHSASPITKLVSWHWPLMTSETTTRQAPCWSFLAVGTVPCHRPPTASTFLV